MSQRVLLVHQMTDESSIAKDLRTMGSLVDEVKSLADGIRQAGQTAFHFAVINQQSLDETSCSPLIRLNQTLQTLPLLVLADQIAIYAYRKIGTLNNFITLQKPYLPKVFETVVQKISAENPIIPSILPRFITDEPVRMLVLGSGLHVTSRMRNYSAGGAFLQYSGISVKVGDQVHLAFNNFHASTPSVPTSFRARVRWIKEGDGPRSPTRGIGVQFDDHTVHVKVAG